MLNDPESLLGRLQRGRGDAVRELLTLAREPAADVLVAGLCTLDEPDSALATHVDAFVELVLDLRPDLSRWFAWLDALPADAPEDDMLFPFHVLGEAAARGHRECDAFLRRYVLHGGHWRVALSEFLRDELELDAAAWRALMPRLDDATLCLHIEPRVPVWKELASGDERVAGLVREVHARRDAHAARMCWSPANYANAPSSQMRWRVLQDLMQKDPDAARPLLVDGLWDGNWCYRLSCIAHCDLASPGVRERLGQLAVSHNSQVAEAAQRRLRSDS